MKQYDRILGSLLAGAAGDALGYEVEFETEDAIFGRYGHPGITEYALHGGLARISDDTQMTLFTANGMLLADARGDLEDVRRVRQAIADCYQDWLITQDFRGSAPDFTRKASAWLARVPGLYQRRAPGNTCLSALNAGGWGSVDDPINRSKGCGGVMRAAPVGLYLDIDRVPLSTVARLGAEAAAITHGHELGYLPAAMLALMAHLLSQREMGMEEAARQSLAVIRDAFPGTVSRDGFIDRMGKALSLARDDISDLDGVHALGEGWVGDEAMAIALFCAARYPGDIEAALIAAVNHRGDSDSTGAVTGNLLGARLGASAIPEKFLTHLELRDVMEALARDLADGPRPDDAWRARYLDARWEARP